MHGQNHIKFERGSLKILGIGFNFPNNEQFSGESYVKKVINTDCVQCNMLIWMSFFVSTANCVAHKQQVNW